MIELVLVVANAPTNTSQAARTHLHMITSVYRVHPLKPCNLSIWDPCRSRVKAYCTDDPLSRYAETWQGDTRHES